ncbi:MAG TPA: NUDIX hydrolase [Candidatus Saccharimonadales bacterium]|nr:NUDIX hydrolase [Candidatus Saccharimonadales bacterium]
MYPNTFYRVSVKAQIKNNNGTVLVLKENQDTWSLPGGGLDHGEDPKMGIVRELKEELGIENPQVEGIVTIKTFFLNQKSAWLLWIVYDVKVNADEFVLGQGVTDARYIDASEFERSEDIFEKMVYEVVCD